MKNLATLQRGHFGKEENFRTQTSIIMEQKLFKGVNEEKMKMIFKKHRIKIGT
jgi:hypothetical protein